VEVKKPYNKSAKKTFARRKDRNKFILSNNFGCKLTK